MSENADALLTDIAAYAKAELGPLANAIDQEGLYPDAFLAGLGERGGFAAAQEPASGGLGLTLAEQIRVTAAVARECGSTAFLVWCQSSCAWYLKQAMNPEVHEAWLGKVASGAQRAGTGMSNTVKHLAGIERINLKAVREGDGYRVSGSLPWVSNMGPDHLAIVAAHVEDEGYVMFAIPCNSDGLSLHDCPKFSGLEGTRTLNLRFADVAIARGNVLAHPDQFKAYIARIKPGFVLGQIGMGLGLVQASLKTLRESNASHAHVNRFLDDQEPALQQELQTLEETTFDLARRAQTGNVDILDVLQARLTASELSLRAAQSAVLHAGAKGYLMRHPAHRRLREAVFVAIVTPALKHLRKEIHDLQQARQAQAA